MKWSHRGHELDEMAEELVQSFHDKQKKIYVFGAGIIGSELKNIVERSGHFGGFIDNDKGKQKNGSDGVKVYSFDDYVTGKIKGLIVIAADKKNIPDIELQLYKANLKKGKDFYLFDEFLVRFFPILILYEDNLLYVDLVQICVTERCTLKCKKCAHGCYAVDFLNVDLDLETAKKSADLFFAKVDIVREFVLIGGEPFLYKGLSEIIKYIGDGYRDKMIIFSITTNGTIMPCQDVLNMCKKYNVLIRISNYSLSVRRLKEKYVQLKKKLDENHISYVLGDEEHQWIDYGFEEVDRKWKTDELMQVFNKCGTPCREIRGSKYYYCVMARSVSENLGIRVGRDDYLDLEKLGKDDKKVLLEFQLGYSEKGYLDMCNYCNGAEAFNYPIPAAEQL